MGDHFKFENDDSGLFRMPDENEEDSYLIPDKAYDVLKWIALIFLPALALFVNTVGPEWGLQNVQPIVITIDAIGLFIGSCIGVSQITKR